MKLDDFLKVKKVRCVKTCGGCLTVGKEYSVLDIRMEIKVKDDEDEDCYWESDRFEPVLDSAENPLQDMKLTPEFKAGDKVYIPNIKNLCTIRNDEKVITSDGQYYCNLSDSHDLCFVLATQENYEMLCKLYPHIDFEALPKELKGSDLCFKKLKSVKKLVICAVSDLSDEKAIKRLQDDDGCIRIIKDCDPTLYHFIDTHGIRHGFAVPLNDETGEPLTEEVPYE